MIPLEIDQNACTGHGRCYDLAPEAFEPDEFGHGVVRAAASPDADRDSIDMAVQACPESAIRYVQ